MIPMWKLAPAIACGNAFILKPSERDPSVPLMLAELMRRRACPRASCRSSTATRRPWTRSSTPRDRSQASASSAPPRSRSTSTRGCANGKRVQCFGGAKNHMIIMPDADMDQAADALIGAGYGAAGERCMAISVAVPVGEETADRLIEKLVPRSRR
jgi:malonate-semialdehyde dehydrogenase (acetylating)/methylmalonate-semialdehyde dehydrogenase